jgi:hypothetical protein
MDTTLMMADLRNHLHTDKPLNELVKAIVSVQDVVSQMHSSPFKQLALSAIYYAIQKIESGNKASAIADIQLIHNLPLVKEDMHLWDKQHFFSIEFQSYIDDCQDWSHFEDIVILLGDALVNFKHIANEPPPN